MENTAMQQLFIALRNTRPDQWIDLLLYNEKNLIEQERKQICDSNDRGFNVGRKNIAETANDYYEETYKK